VVLSLAEGLLSAIAWYDFEGRDSRQVPRSATPASQAKSPASASSSALSLMLGPDGFASKQRQAVLRLLRAVQDYSTQSVHHLANTHGIDAVRRMRAAFLTLDAATYMRFQIYYDQPHFHLPGLLSSDEAVRYASAVQFCTAPDCCQQPGFGGKIKALCPTVQSVLASKPLLALVRSWVTEDCTTTSISVERQHKTNMGILGGVGRRMDIDRFMAASLLMQHSDQHLRNGGIDPKIHIQRLRRNAQLNMRHVLKKAKHKKPSAAGSPLLMYVNEKVSQLPPGRSAADMVAARRGLAAEFRGLGPEEKAEWSTKRRAASAVQKAARALAAIQETQSDSEPDSNAITKSGFNFGCKHWPISLDNLNKALSKRSPGSVDIRKLATQVMDDPVRKQLLIVEENASLICKIKKETLKTVPCPALSVGGMGMNGPWMQLCSYACVDHWQHVLFSNVLVAISCFLLMAPTSAHPSSSTHAHRHYSHKHAHAHVRTHT
jgi:hypothetical protein